MRSSDATARGRAAILGCLLTFAAACSAAGSNQAADAEDCGMAAAGGGDPDVSAIRRATESGPLYALLAGPEPPTCTATSSEGRTVLNYRFDNRGTLRVTTDSAIEYADQDARLADPPKEDPVEILKRVERAMFPEGCGVDWSTPEAQAGPDTPIARERVFRGTTCNCQARVGESASGRIASLGFRSAC